MLTSSLYLIAAFALLFIGAETLVRGSSQLARATGVRPIIIAITIVGFGTSAPELVVTVNASIQHTSDIAVGNIIGSMIANIGLVLGAAALLNPIKIEFGLLKKEIPILLACELLLMTFMWNKTLSRIDGIIMLIGFLIFNWFYLREALKNIKTEKERVRREYEEYLPKRKYSYPLNIFFIIFGIASLLGGSHLVVKGVTGIATHFGISAFVISASVVALGTSIPELATSIIAALRNEHDISVGNILGSNIFNILMCLGAAATVNPLNIGLQVIRIDMLILIGISIFLGIVMWSHMKITRLEGTALLLIYAGYIFYLFH